MEECQAADPGTVPQALETKDRVGVDKFKEKVERLSAAARFARFAGSLVTPE